MAGGRRPANYGSGSRHGPVGSTVSYVSSGIPSTPPNYSSFSPANIWSSPNGSPTSPTTTTTVNHVQVGGTSVLGAALETAVAEAASIAVARAMAEYEAEKATTLSDRSEGSENVKQEQIEEMKTILGEKLNALEEMKRRMNHLEKSLGQELSKRIEAEKELAQEVQNRKGLQMELRRLKETMEKVGHDIGDTKETRIAVVRLERDLWELRKEAQTANGEIKRNIDKMGITVDHLNSFTDKLRDKNETLERNIAASIGDPGSKEATKSLKARLRKIESSVDKMVKESQEGALLDKNLVESLTSRVECVETNLAKLKKLIASNLRTDQKVEEVVKSNVSLITKHVCSAMKQFTAKKITENNQILDNVLRARIPEYAKYGGDDYLLEQDVHEELTVKSKILPPDILHKAIAAIEEKGGASSADSFLDDDGHSQCHAHHCSGCSARGNNKQ